MLKLATVAASACAIVSATPESGCYFYAVPAAAGIDVKAQIEVTSGSTMDFSVYFNVPEMNLPDTTFLCAGEPYQWNAATSTMTVGTTVSACIAELKAKTNGAVATPIDLVYDASAHTLATSIVIPVIMNKASTCVAFASSSTTTTVSADSSVASSTTVVPTGSVAPRTDTTSSTTKSALCFSTVFAVVIALVL